jgi:hypothetical protein
MDKEDIIRMAKEARMPYFYGTWEIANFDGLERFAALVAAYEREECAKVCEVGVVQTNNWDASDYNKACEIRAAAIRNRGER